MKMDDAEGSQQTLNGYMIIFQKLLLHRMHRRVAGDINHRRRKKQRAQQRREMDDAMSWFRERRAAAAARSNTPLISTCRPGTEHVPLNFQWFRLRAKYTAQPAATRARLQSKKRRSRRPLCSGSADWGT